MIRLALCVVAASCGRWRFDPLDDAHAVADGSVDATTKTCSWAGGVLLDTVIHHTELSTMNEADPFLMPGDPLTIHFGSTRDGTADIWTAHRASVGAMFDPPKKLVELNTTTADETALTLDRGGLHGYFTASTTVGAPMDIYEVARPDLGSPLAIVRAVSELDTGMDEFDPWPSVDELTMTFTRAQNPTAKIYVATRTDTGQAWSNIVPFVDNVGGFNTGATQTANGLTIVFSIDSDLYYATRASTVDTFSPAQKIPNVNTPQDEYEPSIREDGCELFFARGSNGLWDIYSTLVLSGSG